MAKILYLLRHGQTLFNQLGLKQGACDSPLTDLGIEQAKISGQYLRVQGVEFEVTYSSTKERACDTIELAYGTNYTRLKGIKEWHFGRHEATPEYLEPDRKPNGAWAFVNETGASDDYYAHFGGESQEQVLNRATETLAQVMEKASDEANILALSHGALVWTFYLAYRRDKSVPPKTLPKLGNCTIHRYLYEDGTFTYLDSASPLEWAEDQKNNQK